jgi:hypothetical protein
MGQGHACICVVRRSQGADGFLVLGQPGLVRGLRSQLCPGNGGIGGVEQPAPEERIVHGGVIGRELSQ